MASDIFRNMVEQKINIFVSTFGENANNLFKIDNKLIHPLEYGMYRERCAKELLKLICDRNTEVSDGFIISSNNNVSTQCDIILYQRDTMSIIDNGISNFFPVEIVKCIGEIKSTLDKRNFSEALVKMAKNKAMFLQRQGAQDDSSVSLKEKDEIVSFLICNKLSFDIDNIDFDEIYKEIPNIRFRHNMILSLQDGLLLYEFDADRAPEILKKHFTETVEKVEPVMWFFSHSSVGNNVYKCEPLVIKPDKDDIYRHIIHFLNGLKNAMFLQREYVLDIGNYLTNNAIELRSKQK